MATTKTYKRLEITKSGEPVDVLQVKEVPLHTQVAADQVLLKMRAAPVNPSDLLLVRGVVKPGFIGPIGNEGVGVVEIVGSNVSNLKAGQRVAFYTFGAVSGTWGEYFLLDVTLVPVYIVVPDGLSDEVAAQLVLNPLTLLGMLKEMHIKSGEWFLQTAAAGALGRQLIQYAKLKGYHSINVVRRAEQIAELKALGADEVILQDDKLIENVKNVKPDLKYALDAVSGKIPGMLLQTLVDGGLLQVYGVLSSHEIIVPFMALVPNDVSLKAYVVFRWLKKVEETRKALSELTQLVSDGKLRLSAKPFKFSNWAEAIKYSEKPGKSEKPVLMFQ